MANDPYNGERVLVVPTMLFHELGYFEGFSPASMVGAYLDTLLDAAHTRFLPRSEVEEDPSYKQLIPYCLLHHEGRLFHYLRGDGIGEGRLLGKRSVGIGGHIAAADADGNEDPYQVGMERELAEEVALGGSFRSEILGLINDDQSPVGRVHLGVVHLLELKRPEVEPREKEIEEFGFAPVAELADRGEEFESWSRICLRHLADGRLSVEGTTPIT